MNAIIEPKPILGTVLIPPSKSCSHRAIICASLAKGKSVINNIILSDDIIATVEAMEKIGAKIIKNPYQLVIHGQGKVIIGDDNFIDCKESGSTIRFLMPVMALSKQKVVFTGKAGLFKRPMSVYEDLFNQMGFLYQQSEKGIILSGSLQSGNFELPGNLSSQFISGLLFALPLLKEDSTITLTTTLESAEYVDITIHILKQFGIQIHVLDNGYHIPGNQSYQASTMEVESDYSQLAFFAVAGSLSGPINAKKFKSTISAQPDRRIIDYINQMGGSIIHKGNEYCIKKSKTSGRTIDVSQCPDIAPILALLGALSTGKTIIENASRLKLKESNRLKTTFDTLQTFGVDVEMTEDSLIIQGENKALNGGIFDSFGDHRIAMMIAIGAIRAKGPVLIKNAESVNKSYPHFFDDYISLGGEVHFTEN
jgi:3-phosphoshikimate 1-carboxyvinyltransferase